MVGASTNMWGDATGGHVESPRAGGTSTNFAPLRGCLRDRDHGSREHRVFVSSALPAQGITNESRPREGSS
jgi:hypothetical protein